MKITYSWIKEFVDVRATPKALADKLSMAGLSVASLESLGGDWLYDIEVTSNRPDWLSVRGIAREVAAITGSKFKPAFFAGREKESEPFGKAALNRPKDLFNIVVEDKHACPLYCAGLIKNIKVGVSPDWLKRRLESVGLKPINNVVDITNFLMLEYGQPLHAFDYRKIKDAKIIARKARQGEGLVLLDGSKKNLDSGVLVIADSQNPMAAAGIMGGEGTQVGFQTVDVLVESAYFDPCVVRRGTRRLGVISDSSYRFERGVDIEGVHIVLAKALRLMRDMGGGDITLIKSAGALPLKGIKKIRPPINFSLQEAIDLLGVDISRAQVKQILDKLGFRVKAKSKDVFEVSAPSFRRDIAIREDIAEEIARIYGYEKIPVTCARIQPCAVAGSKPRAVESVLKQALVNMSFKEVVTYSLQGEQDFKKTALDIPADALKLKNPLSWDYCMLRTMVLPGLLGCAAHNINHGNKNFEIFESGRVFKADEENMNIGILACGARRASWRSEYSAYSMFDMKGVLETLLEELVAGKACVKGDDAVRAFESGEGFVLSVHDQAIGVFGRVSQGVKKAWDIKAKEDIFVAEIYVDALCPLTQLKKTFKTYILHPAIIRDLSLIVPRAVSYEKISALIFAQGGDFVKDVSLVERYQGKEITPCTVGLTVTVEYRSSENTLTDARINLVHEQVVKSLRDELSVSLR